MKEMLKLKWDKYKVTEVPISVPERLGRYGLSEVINHLLGHEKASEIVPFDFLYTSNDFFQVFGNYGNDRFRRCSNPNVI